MYNWFGPHWSGPLAALVYQLIYLAPSQKLGAAGGGTEEVTPAVLYGELKKIQKALQLASNLFLWRAWPLMTVTTAYRRQRN